MLLIIHFMDNGKDILGCRAHVAKNKEITLQKKCISATHNCNALCVAEIICNALCVADFAMQKTGLQIFCNASQRCVAEICNALGVADWKVRPTLWWNSATEIALQIFSATSRIALQNISASDV